MSVEAWAGLPTGMDGRGSCPAHANIPQFPVGGPIKGVHYTPSGFSGGGALSTERVVAVDLPHYQHHPHLQSCWRNNLDLVTVKWKTIAKVGVAALRPPTLCDA